MFKIIIFSIFSITLMTLTLLFAPLPELKESKVDSVFTKANLALNEMEINSKKELLNAYIKQEDLDNLIVDYKRMICAPFMDYKVRKGCKTCLKVSRQFNKNYKKYCTSIDDNFKHTDKLFSFFKSSNHILNLEYKQRKYLERKNIFKNKIAEEQRKRNALINGSPHIARIEDFKPLPDIETALSEDYYMSFSDGIRLHSTPNIKYHHMRIYIYQSLSPILKKIIKSPAKEAIASIKELATKSKEYKKICDKYQSDPLFYSECASKFINTFNYNELMALTKKLN